MGSIGFYCDFNNLFEFIYRTNRDKVYGLWSLFQIKTRAFGNFFSSVRRLGDLNDNPSAIQFRTACKRLLVRHQISASIKANVGCDDTPILNVACGSKKKTVDLSMDFSYDNDSKEQLQFELFFMTIVLRLSKMLFNT